MGGDSVVQLDKANTRTKGRKKRRANEIGLRILRFRDIKVQIMKEVGENSPRRPHILEHSVDKQEL